MVWRWLGGGRRGGGGEEEGREGGLRYGLRDLVVSLAVVWPRSEVVWSVVCVVWPDAGKVEVETVKEISGLDVWEEEFTVRGGSRG